MDKLPLTPHATNPWEEEPPLLPDFGDHSWNLMSPEKEFCDYVVQALGSLQNTRHRVSIIETGVGQGFVTRRVINRLRVGDNFLGYDTAQWCLDLIPEEYKDWFVIGSPSKSLIGVADLVILDSEIPQRERELQLWIDHGKPGSELIIHDVPERMNPPSNLHKMVTRAHFKDSWTTNHRGGWHGVHN